MTIRIIVQFRVSAENFIRFENFVAAATEIAQRKEAGRTLGFDFFTADDDPLSFVFEEVFADAAALRTHIENLGPLQLVAREVFVVERMICIGDIPAPILTQFKQIGIAHAYTRKLAPVAEPPTQS